MSAVARIIDANANRAREAFRVLEDIARFALDDGALAGEAKAARHALRETLDRLPAGWLTAGRDIEHDVGRELSAAGESRRAGLADIAGAAGARLSEALRVLEETAKTVDPSMALDLERLRYRGYALAAAVEGRLGTGRARQWPLCLLLTESFCRHPWPEVLAGAIDAGCTCVQVREPDFNDRALVARVRGVIAAARSAGVTVIVNDRVDVALAADADGVHVGQSDMDIADVRRLAGRTLLVGVSTRTIDQARTALADGADYLGLGAMFATGTKETQPPVGPAWVRAFRDRFPDVPHLAIGGIGPANVAAVVAAGARGVAACAAICGADDPTEAVRGFLAALDERGPVSRTHVAQPR